MNLENIINTVNAIFEVDIRLDTRKTEVLIPRQIYYKIAYSKTEYTLDAIAQLVGGKQDHSTASHALRVIDDKLLKRNNVRYKIGYKECLNILSDNMVVNINSSETLDQLKQRYIQELLDLQAKNEVKIANTERKYLKQQEFFKGLLTLPREQLKEFHDTRIVPYMRMNSLSKVS